MSAVTDTEIKELSTLDKLTALRRKMQANHVDAYLVPSADEHINEYLPENKTRRAWISNFTGSAGDLLVLQDTSWLFVDSRYHEQADYEVELAHIQVSKLGLDGQPTLSEKLKEIAGQRTKFKLGFDPFTLSVQQYQAFQKAFEGVGLELVPVPENLVDLLWVDAPKNPAEAVFALSDVITGQSVAQKLAAVRERMAKLKVQVLPITKLDQIAWLYNLRGKDIPYNPVFLSYAILTLDRAYLFTDTQRIQPDDLKNLRTQVEVHAYEHYISVLKQLAAGTPVLVDPKHTTFGTLTVLQNTHGKIREGEHPVELMKAVKNDAEINGMQQANLKASRGKIRAWYWLEQQLSQHKTVTEASFRDAIERFYAEEEGFFGLSFNTISGAGVNSSIVHYGTPSPDKKLESGELFLIDSGCQFLGSDFAGTTDDTRTMLVGDQPTDLQKLRYTEVLKAHINCAMQKFPKGTEGVRLDGITRSTLWQHGLDYGHGTGHGVGAFLNVHEGPNGIHKLATKPFEPGMVTSIEPGYYEPGWGGIRLENLYRSIDCGDGQYGFESLIYIPFDKKLIDFERLSEQQLAWLKSYYQVIVEKIAPTLSSEESSWLKDLCDI